MGGMFDVSGAQGGGLFGEGVPLGNDDLPAIMRSGSVAEAMVLRNRMLEEELRVTGARLNAVLGAARHLLALSGAQDPELLKLLAPPTQPFVKYRRTQLEELRPYTEGEALDERVSIAAVDREAGSPRAGDMIARNPENHDDQWLVAEEYFKLNFEPIEEPDEAPAQAPQVDAGEGGAAESPARPLARRKR